MPSIEVYFGIAIVSAIVSGLTLYYMYELISYARLPDHDIRDKT